MFIHDIQFFPQYFVDTDSLSAPFFVMSNAWTHRLCLQGDKSRMAAAGLGQLT